jgi:hypothetical protein
MIVYYGHGVCSIGSLVKNSVSDGVVSPSDR